VVRAELAEQRRRAEETTAAGLHALRAEAEHLRAGLAAAGERTIRQEQERAELSSDLAG